MDLALLESAATHLANGVCVAIGGILAVLASFFLLLSLLDLDVLRTTLLYYRALVYFIFQKASFAECPYFPSNIRAKCHVYQLSLVLRLWTQPHYRSSSLQQDLKDNLRNVALPGTGVPLSWFCYHWTLAFVLIFIGAPLACLVAAYHRSSSLSHLSTHYRAFLLSPDDWFSLWQTNCRMAFVHALVTRAPGYAMENKWTFLKEGQAKGVAVSPYLQMPRLVVKNKNMEGGLGIHFFANACEGGDWIIQLALDNAPEIAKLLPKNAPLSTFRVLTTSQGALHPHSPTTTPSGHQALISDLIAPICCVFRAGRAGAATDHQSILYDVDQRTGEIKAGATNEQWYRLGASHFAPWRAPRSPRDYSVHPDSQERIVGAQVGNVQAMFAECVNAHLKLLPDVPIVGWDVALTPNGSFLLEANLSCNFFLGSFDQERYFSFVHDVFSYTDTLL